MNKSNGSRHCDDNTVRSGRASARPKKARTFLSALVVRGPWPWPTRISALLTICAVLVAAGAWAEGSSQTLVLEPNRSTLLKFQGMWRVAVVDPQVADVSVMSESELLVRGVDLGETMMYVWDKRGMHKFAVSVVGKTPAQMRAEELRKSLGPALSVRVFGDRTVVVEGQVKDEVAMHNLSTLLEAASDEQAKVVSMIAVAGMYPSAAAQAGHALSKVLDPRLEVTTWGDASLLIEGELDDHEQVLHARQLISAFSEGVKVVDMITVKGETLADQAPVAQLQKLLGEGFRVSQLRGNLVAVDGQVGSEDELNRVNRLLEVFEDQVQTINLVQVLPPKPNLVAAQSTLQAALGEGITVKLVGEDALMLEGAVPSEERGEQVNRVLALFEDRVPIVNLLTVVEPDKRQVLVAVKVLDINRGDTETLGIDWGQYAATEGDATYRPQPFLFGHVYGRGGWHRLYDFAHQIHALIQDQRARVLSEPNLMVNEEEEAEILIGGEIPIPVSQAGAGGVASITVEWKPYGVKLNIKPTISPDAEKVELEVAPEVSSLDYGNAVTIGGLVLPALRSRKAQTKVTMPDGGVLAIGGLLQSDQSKAVDKIPLLGDLPIIGQLFRHDTFINNESELIILVRPQILDETGKPLHPIPLPEGVSREQVFSFERQQPLPEVELEE